MANNGSFVRLRAAVTEEDLSEIVKRYSRRLYRLGVSSKKGAKYIRFDRGLVFMVSQTPQRSVITNAGVSYNVLLSASSADPARNLEACDRFERESGLNFYDGPESLEKVFASLVSQIYRR